MKSYDMTKLKSMVSFCVSTWLVFLGSVTIYSAIYIKKGS